jgi:hypothetical protein
MNFIRNTLSVALRVGLLGGLINLGQAMQEPNQDLSKEQGPNHDKPVFNSTGLQEVDPILKEVVERLNQLLTIPQDLLTQQESLTTRVNNLETQNQEYMGLIVRLLSNRLNQPQPTLKEAPIHPMHLFPLEIWAHIFSFLGKQDRNKIELLDKAFRVFEEHQNNFAKIHKPKST